MGSNNRVLRLTYPLNEDFDLLACSDSEKKCPFFTILNFDPPIFDHGNEAQ